MDARYEILDMRLFRPIVLTKYGRFKTNLLSGGNQTLPHEYILDKLKVNDLHRLTLSRVNPINRGQI